MGTLISYTNFGVRLDQKIETKMQRTAALYVIIDLTFIVDLKSEIFEDIYEYQQDFLIQIIFPCLIHTYCGSPLLLTNQKAVSTVQLKSRSVIGPSGNTLVC